MGGAVFGLDASWLSGAEEAGKKAFHSCGLPRDTDYSHSGSLHCVCLHTLHHVITVAMLCYPVNLVMGKFIQTVLWESRLRGIDISRGTKLPLVITENGG